MKDANSLECQGTDGRLVGSAFCALLPVVGPCPERFVDGLARPLDKGLTQKPRALPAPVHPTLLAAALDHGRDARVFLQVFGFRKAFTLLAESGEQTGRQMRTGARQGRK